MSDTAPNRSSAERGTFITLNDQMRELLWARVKAKPLKGVKAKPGAQWLKPGPVGRVRHLTGEQQLRHATLREIRQSQRQMISVRTAARAVARRPHSGGEFEITAMGRSGVNENRSIQFDRRHHCWCKCRRPAPVDCHRSMHAPQSSDEIPYPRHRFLPICPQKRDSNVAK